ncbi:acetolactate synthase, large subunit, biosynthetic type [Thermobaculum terrenum ATCC BAA-798]|uniref:Acetolactate synthase n=1 Tax=Thermobaculum terrenum (strain ATCC BAA-798 / CCMEE 7001 / YNP1) TaxID=525904 RepID=D1CDV2_THET1|nr:biosynthetic-type acetolactate synthase large subunit [Thermobaculum terrenum]ACZ41108.1 acetolactate synthase, large subunit, biosynthetic type [Thermobaculum terrenum ATCC BAA-798]
MAITIDKPKIEETKKKETKKLSGARIMCEALVNEGVEIIWGYPGGAIMPFYDVLPEYPSIHHVLVRHEQGAAHAADGYARVTGKVGVCVATSGPGATNLVTGLATAYMDSVPIVAITGQVARPFIGHDSFQETDIVGITLPITKHNFLVTSADSLGEVIHEAFRIAREGRPGPVLIDVPKDVQFEEGEYTPPEKTWEERNSDNGSAYTDEYIRAARIIDSAQRPLIMAGHGIIISKAYDELRAFAEKTGIPVITTLLGLSAFPENHPLALGMPGMHGPAHVNLAIDEADLIVGVGLRFDDRVTGNLKEFAPNARFIHIDIDPAEIGKNIKPEVGIVADAKEALAKLTELVSKKEHSGWLEEIKRREKPERSVMKTTKISPYDVLKAIKKATNGEARIVTDVGQHQMWAARFYGWEKPNSHISSGGLGTMGYALPAAMGVKAGCPEDPVWVVAGDGGIQMNIQELGTIVQENLDIKVAIINNGYLGMVRQWQEFFHNRNYSETRISSPDYSLIATAYGAKGRRVTRKEDVEAAVEWAMSQPGCVILDFEIEQEANVYPMVPSGGSVKTMILDPEANE